MIPQEKASAVTRGLREAFGVTGFEDIQMLKGGPSLDYIFRIRVKGSPFLLRLITRTHDPLCHFTCMRAAAEAGLAPRVCYTSADDRISITEFLQAAPFPHSEAPLRMADTLRKLHSLPPFPPRADHLNTSCTFLLRPGTLRDRLLETWRATTALPRAEVDQLFAVYDKLAAVYRQDDQDMVSSHNDLFKPDNVLFDGERVWLLDWEAAFLNDRYADLAVVANLVANQDEDEETFLQAYFGQPPDAYQLARFFLMRQVSHIFYAIAFLLMSPSGTPVDLTKEAPSLADFCRRFWTGEVRLDNPETKIQLGRVHLEQLWCDIRQPRFGESLRLLAERNLHA